MRGGIELYVGIIDQARLEASYDACRAILSPDEKLRAARFVFARHRQHYVLAHGLLRYALSDAAPQIAPSEWSFRTDRYGRPFVAGPANPEQLYFNLSHTDGCVACVVSGYEAVGVDVECVQDRAFLMETAATAFSAEEVQLLRGLAGDELIERFFAYWTVREAFLKAKGRGLDFPLDAFSMHVSADGITLNCGPSIDDNPARWRFAIDVPSPSHRLAIADGSGVKDLAIVRHSWPV
jgi:4'-phosphopantetheinyl transferase